MTCLSEARSARFARSKDSLLDAVLKGAFTVPGDGSLDFEAIAKRLATKSLPDPAKRIPAECSRRLAKAPGKGQAHMLHQQLHRARHMRRVGPYHIQGFGKGTHAAPLG